MNPLERLNKDLEPKHLSLYTPSLHPMEKYQHRHLHASTMAYYNTSFDPERRGESECKEFDAMAKELADSGASGEQLAKFESLFLAKIGAQGRCISSMITGGSNFPVARAEKANQSAHNRLNEFLDFYNKTLERLKKEAYYKTHPEELPIKSSDDNAVERLTKEVEELKARQEKMKIANKLIKAKDESGLVALVGEQVAKELVKPNCFGDYGFERFELSNNLANIKRLEERIEQIKKAKSLSKTVVDLKDGAVAVQDPEQMRVYVEFNGKPSQEIIGFMKSSGFKWTPSKGHWGRLLNGNGQYALQQVIERLKI